MDLVPRYGRPLGVAPLICALALLLAGAAQGAPPPIAAPPSTSGQDLDNPAPANGLLTNLKRSNFLLGDLFGLRSALSRDGLSLAIQETSEALGNPSGGYRRGADYDGLTQVVLQFDTQRAFGWHGGLLNVSALQIHGRNLSADNLGALQTVSGIEADRATRLWEAWYDQKLLDEDRLSLRIGQQSADQEFIVNANGAYFLNTMFGWPMVPSADLPGGGPAYPLSAPAIRVKYRIAPPMTVLLGVFDGAPAPTQPSDPQIANSSGLTFVTHRGVLMIAEAQFSWPALGSMSYPGQGAPLGHTWRIGAWYDSAAVVDQRFDTAGLSLADPGSSGLARQHHGDWSAYASGDQMVWRNPRAPNQSISLFGRAMVAPQADRNLVTFSVDGGVVMHAPTVSRPDDTIALGAGYARVSPHVAGLDRDILVAEGLQTGPVRSGETFIEATYQYQVHPWWQLQPDVQLIFNPGAGAANPQAPSRRIGNELVMGMRTNVLF